MKKLILIAVCAFGFTAMHAQRGILLQGNLGYSKDEVKITGSKTTTDSYDISPIVGYQFNKNWAVAVAPSFSTAKEKANGVTTKKETTKIGGLVRYVMPLSETFAVYGDLGGGYKQIKDKVTGNPSEKKDGFYVGFTPALFINFKNNFGLNFAIGGIEYSHLKEKQGNKAKTNEIDINFGKAVQVGISKTFGF